MTAALPASTDSGTIMPHTAILLAPHGTAVADARLGFERLARDARAAHPEARVLLTPTSRKVRVKMLARGEDAPSPVDVLRGLAKDGVQRLVIQSLHTLAASEYESILAARDELLREFPGLRAAVGRPLLATADDVRAAAEASLSYAPADRTPDEAVVFVAHGASHAADGLLDELFAELARRDPLLLGGRLEGSPSAGNIARTLRQKGVRRAHLLPFMCVGGYHVQVDVASDSPQSWSSIFRREGLTPLPRITGTSEHPPFRTLWLDHLKEAMASLDTRQSAD
ncbi:sirohydrochlorin cobaltochelatase [Desulfohalovibrio reitneri]|uniref:sirohydrochlorin cobaltochelatase n=1 Tax=Desulfohalovibrio reitneri TaxID=1307759 RepID=UPI0004A6CEA5|nr:sirohydrochlorin cobaltochelatase [Desulfohalovibrio reitneri]